MLASKRAETRVFSCESTKGAWYIETSEGRTYCSRGITSSGLCL